MMIKILCIQCRDKAGYRVARAVNVGMRPCDACGREAWYRVELLPKEQIYLFK